MRFIDENSLHRLNFKELLSRVDVLSAYGKQKLNSIENFLLGQEEKLEKEFDVWLWDTIETGFQVLKTEEEVEDWERMDQ